MKSAALWAVATVICVVVCLASFPRPANGKAVGDLPAAVGIRRNPLGVILRMRRHEPPSHEKSNCTAPCNETGKNSTLERHTVAESTLLFIGKNKDVIVRALIVFGSISAIVLVYVAFRCIRRHRLRSKSRKYGLITMPDDKLELKPLDDDDDDDEDMTVFDRTRPKTVNSHGTTHRSKPLMKHSR